jgi:hypothetical protein
VEDDRLLLTALLETRPYKFDPEARIILEVQRQTNVMRFDLGIVESQTGLQRQHLVDFDQRAASTLTFVIKVVSPSGEDHGRILGIARKLKVSLPDESENVQQGILPFRASDDLGQRVWRLDMSGEEPVVLINRNVGDWNAFARAPQFCALVYPELIRSVARWEVEKDHDSDDIDQPWGILLRRLGYDPSSAPRDELLEDWLDDVASEFSDRHSLLELVRVEEED